VQGTPNHKCLHQFCPPVHIVVTIQGVPAAWWIHQSPLKTIFSLSLSLSLSPSGTTISPVDGSLTLLPFTKSSILPASVCHLQCSFAKQLEKSQQLLMWTLFQICHKQCMPVMLSLLPASVCLFNCNAVGEVTALDLDSVPNLSRVVCV
jgi:hypothetical protein